MIETTPSDVISRSAAAVAAAASTQVESARTGTTVRPPRTRPDSLTSAMASSAPAAMSGVSDSIGPVKPNMMPIFTSSACAAAVNTRTLAAARSVFFMIARTPF